MSKTQDTELFELCKEVYKRTGWDNKSNTASSERLKVWQKAYSISEMGQGNDDYETTPIEERNKVNVYDWEIRDDPRHRITTGQEVFKWWYSEVKTIENNVIPLYISDYLLEKLPEEIDKKLLVLTNGDRPYAGYAQRDDYGHHVLDDYFYRNASYSNTCCKALLKLTVALDDAGIKL